MKENPQFTAWSNTWKDERKTLHIGRILELWQTPLPQRWGRKDWSGSLGYRKRSSHRGEQIVEKLLLERESKGFDVFFPGNTKQTTRVCRIEALYHNMPLVNQKRGQVLADAFGVLEIGGVRRPLFIEVKVTDNNSWYALVENLQQIRLARACAQTIQEFVLKKTGHYVQRGIWGLVLAPRSYFDQHKECLGKSKGLLKELKYRTQARVAFGISDFLESGRIEIIATNWLGLSS